MSSGARATHGLRERFAALHGPPAGLATAPGRVNLIGEHTDYNDGLALPVAIDLRTSVAFAPRDDGRWLVRSEAFPDDGEVELATAARRERHWSDYPAGVLRVLLDDGVRVRGGGSLRIASDVPVGAGLSSSAALEVATALAVLALAGEERSPEDVALLCQRAESELVGTRCGIMDQLVACLGRSGAAMLLDCRTRAVRFVPLPSGIELVVVGSGVRHALATGEYNRRRGECEEAARLLAGAPERTAPVQPPSVRAPSVQPPSVRAPSPRAPSPRPPSLRDVAIADLERARPRLDERIYRRARHVVTENERVQETVAALEAGDLERVGDAMARSHVSLRDDFEVSCPELDLLVEIAAAQPGVVGARMTGGGFGGCTVNLVRSEAVASFLSRVRERFAAATGSAPDVWVTTAVAGAVLE